MMLKVEDIHVYLEGRASDIVKKLFVLGNR